MTTPETAPVEVTQADNDLADWFRRRMEGYTRSQIAPMLARHRTTNETARQDGLREAAKQAREVIRIERDHLIDCCTLRGDRETLDEGAKPDVARMDAAIDAIDTALSDISPLANDTGALREDREQGEIIITGLMEVLDDLLKGQDSAYWLLRERARWWLNGDEKPAALSDISPLANDTGALREALPADVRRLVIAAREIAFNDWDGDSEEWEVARKELDDASEAFASRVPWADEPKGLSPDDGEGK